MLLLSSWQAHLLTPPWVPKFLLFSGQRASLIIVGEIHWYMQKVVLQYHAQSCCGNFPVVLLSTAWVRYTLLFLADADEIIRYGIGGMMRSVFTFLELGPAFICLRQASCYIHQRCSTHVYCHCYPRLMLSTRVVGLHRRSSESFTSCSPCKSLDYNCLEQLR